MRRAIRATLVLLTVALIASERASVTAFQGSSAPPAAGQGKLIVFGDVAMFLGRPGFPGNCAQQSRFKHGEPVGFRMTAIDPATGEREPSAQFVVHLTYGGMTQDLTMRYWVAKWIVPATAPVGIVRYTVTASDKYGRTGEFKPFPVEDSQLTIVD